MILTQTCGLVTLLFIFGTLIARWRGDWLWFRLLRVLTAMLGVVFAFLLVTDYLVGLYA